MFRAHIRVVQFVGEKIRAPHNVFERWRQCNDVCGSRRGTSRCFVETEFDERLFLEPHMGQEDTTETGLFQKDSQQQMFWLNRFVSGNTRTITPFFEAWSGLGRPFLAEV